MEFILDVKFFPVLIKCGKLIYIYITPFMESNAFRVYIGLLSMVLRYVCVSLVFLTWGGLQYTVGLLVCF